MSAIAAQNTIAAQGTGRPAASQGAAGEGGNGFSKLLQAVKGPSESGKTLPADGSDLPEDGNPFSEADPELLQALFGIGKEGAKALTELSAEEGQALLGRLQEMLGKLDLQGEQSLTDQLEQLLKSGNGESGDSLTSLLQLGEDGGAQSLQGLLQGNSDGTLMTALRGLGNGDNPETARQAAAVLLASAGKGTGDGARGVEALRQRLEGLDLPPETRQRLEAALQGAQPGKAGQNPFSTQQSGQSAEQGVNLRADAGQGGGESRLQAFLRAGLQSLGSNGSGEGNAGERNLSLKALDGENLLGRQSTLLTGAGSGTTGSESARGGDPAALRAAAMGLSTQAGSGSGFGGGFGASTGGFGSAFAGTSTAGTIANSPLGASVNGQGWNQAMGERVVFMARNGIQSANVRLHPQNLGPLDIRVSVQNEQASVTFNVQNASTREAVEQALPRLRELFEQQGMDLVDVDVSDQQQQFAEGGEHGTGGDGQPGHAGSQAEEGDDGPAISLTPAEVAARGGVDYYA